MECWKFNSVDNPGHQKKKKNVWCSGFYCINKFIKGNKYKKVKKLKGGFIYDGRI